MNDQHPKSLTASNFTKQAISDFASEFADELGHEPSSEGLRQAVRRLGGRITEVNFLDFGRASLVDSGSLLINGEADFEIKLSDTTSLSRDNFTIAHELGHYILHYIMDEKIDKSKQQKYYAERLGNGRIEWEANWFASSFLMPSDKFRTAFREYKEDLGRVSTQFGVSRQAAEIRAETLKLIPKDR